MVFGLVLHYEAERVCYSVSACPGAKKLGVSETRTWKVRRLIALWNRLRSFIEKKLMGYRGATGWIAQVKYLTPCDSAGAELLLKWPSIILLAN
jgi:hypothetical protein